MSSSKFGIMLSCHGTAPPGELKYCFNCSLRSLASVVDRFLASTGCWTSCQLTSFLQVPGTTLCWSSSWSISWIGTGYLQKNHMILYWSTIYGNSLTSYSLKQINKTILNEPYFMTSYKMYSARSTYLVLSKLCKTTVASTMSLTISGLCSKVPSKHLNLFAKIPKAFSTTRLPLDIM